MSTWPIMILSLGPNRGFWSKGRRGSGVQTTFGVSSIFYLWVLELPEDPVLAVGLGLLPPSLPGTAGMAVGGQKASRKKLSAFLPLLPLHFHSDFMGHKEWEGAQGDFPA